MTPKPKAYTLEARSLPVQVRMKPEEKAELLEACELTGQGLASFMREAALLKARGVIAGKKT